MPELIIDIATLALLIVLVVRVEALRRRAQQPQQSASTVAVATAATDTVPLVPHTDDPIIAEWKAARAAEPPGSPRHTAYTNRLRSLGIECGD